MEITYPRCAGIDVGKRKIAVAVRTPGDTHGERCQQIRMYKTYYRVRGGVSSGRYRVR